MEKQFSINMKYRPRALMFGSLQNWSGALPTRLSAKPLCSLRRQSICYAFNSQSANHEGHKGSDGRRRYFDSRAPASVPAILVRQILTHYPKSKFRILRSVSFHITYVHCPIARMTSFTISFMCKSWALQSSSTLCNEDNFFSKNGSVEYNEIF